MLQKSFPLSALGIALAIVTGSTVTVRAANFNQLIVFGDSLSDQGNFLPLTSNNFPNLPYYFPGRFSNGLVWTDYLAEDLGLSVNTISYALGGATSGSTNISPIQIGLREEIAAFKQETNLFGQPVTLDTAPLYTLWAGANDYLLTQGTVADPSQQQSLVNQTLANLSSALQVLVNAGAHDIVVSNLSDLTRSPLIAQTTAQQKQNLLKLIGLHNQASNQTLQDFRKTYPRVNFTEFDIYHFFNDILANSTLLGFSNTTVGCTITDLYNNYTPAPDDLYNSGCNDQLDVQNTFFFWDSAHPNTAVHKLIAQSVFALLNPSQSVSVPEQASPLSLLVLGVGAVALMTLKRRYH